MSQDCGQRRGKPEAVGQHVLRTALAQLFPEPLVSIQNLPDDGFSAGRIHISLFHRRASWKPASLFHIFLDEGKVLREVFLHEAITIRATEVEDVMRILFKQL